jgi:bifunctional non-homologous end joining protein LigD
MYAPGIPRKDYLGNEKKILPKQILDYVVQKHLALRRGLHYDLRIGDKPMGMFSWALNYPPPKYEGDTIGAIRTNLHSSKYNKFEGEIPKGLYGAGTVSTYDKGKVLITNTTPTTISFSIADKKHPERFTLIHPGEDKQWILLKNKTPDDAGAEKEHYKSIPKDKIIDFIKNLPSDYTTQPKLDGALQFVNLNKGKVEMLSHRISKTTGKPVLQTERFFGHRPHLDIPSDMNNSVFQAEVYAHDKDGKPLKSQTTSGVLNSTVENALNSKIGLKAMLFNVSKLSGKDVRDLPYDEKLKILEKAIKLLPKGKFHLPDKVNDSMQLWKDILNKKHHSTDEGLVIHPPQGTPFKAKVYPEQDVYIRSFFKATPGSKYHDNSVGGFNYSHTPDGPIVGKVGTGIDDLTRKLWHENPNAFIGRKTRVHSQGAYESGALRAPAFISMHEG